MYGISFHSYIGVIKRRDGFLGLYAGFAPRVMEMGAAHAATLAFNTYWPEDKTDKDGQQHLGSGDLTDPDEQRRVWRSASRGAAQRLAVIAATQPFQVVMVRCMAQFVGKEDKYNGPISAIREIIEQNGILGENN